MTFLCIAVIIGCDMSEETYQSDVNVNVPVQQTDYVANPINEPEAGNPAEVFDNYNKLTDLLGFSMSKSMAKHDYPETYGGTFVNDDGKLVVMLTKGDANFSKKLRKTIGGDVIYQECEFSYNYMCAVIDTIIEKTAEPASKNVVMHGIDNERNRVIVFLRENSVSNQEEFKKYIANSPCIEFGESTYFTDDALSCADSVSFIESSGAIFNGSVGYRAMSNDGTTVGFVTAGHCVGTGELLADPTDHSLIIGYCVESRCDNGMIDGAFCEVTDTAFYPTNRIMYMSNPSVDTLSTTLSQPPQNVYVNMVGMRSQRQSGKVLFSSIAIRDSITGAIILSDAILADYSSVHGDSGGIVYSLVKSTNTRYTVGVNKGHGKVSVGGKVYRGGICTKAYMINNQLGVHRF